jgi:hypothetical protein
MESKKNDFNFLLEMFKDISLFKYGAMIGVVLLVIEFVWSRRDAKKVSNPE